MPIAKFECIGRDDHRESGNLKPPVSELHQSDQQSIIVFIQSGKRVSKLTGNRFAFKRLV